MIHNYKDREVCTAGHPQGASHRSTGTHRHPPPTSQLCLTNHPTEAHTPSTYVMSMNHSSSYERSSIERRHTTQARRADSASPPHHRSICSNSASVEHSDDCLWLRKHPRQHTAHAAQLAHGAPSPCWPQPASLRRCAAQASFSIAAGTGATRGTQQMRHSLRYRQVVLAKVSAAQGRRGRAKSDSSRRGWGCRAITRCG